MQSILLYGLECWALTDTAAAALLCKLISFHNKCVQRMCRVTLAYTHEPAPGQALLRTNWPGIPSIQETIGSPRMRWIGHLACIPMMERLLQFLTSWVVMPWAMKKETLKTVGGNV